MLWHNHVWRRELVSGAPDPEDPDDDQLLLAIPEEHGATMLSFTRKEWAPLFQALRRYQPAHGRDQPARTDP